MDSSDDDFLRELQAAFQVEADEHLQAMSSGLLELESAAGLQPSSSQLETIFREAHSLKGASRAVNRADIEAVCQALETVFAAWKRQGVVSSPELYDTLHQALDLIGELLSAAGEGNRASDKQRISALTRRLSLTASEKTAEPDPTDVGAGFITPSSPSLSSPSSTGKGTGGLGSSETVRISTAKLDAVLLQVEELLAVKLTASRRAADLRETQSETLRTLGQWKKAAAALSSESLPPAIREFLAENHAFVKSLEGRLNALAKSAEQDRREIGGKVDTLLDDTKNLLLLPFSTLLGAFPRMVRDLARDEGKEVQFVLQGGGVEIDKRILEEMKDPLIHLLRNSVDHGIETPDERAAAQKPARATVTLAVTQVSGGEVEILISDDGAGIDTARVKASAVKHGILSEEAAGRLEEAQALDLIFQSEVSSSPIITEISGRGLGMAIVREKTEALGGRIEIETRRGQGTAFRILLPLTLATFKGILVRAADQIFVVPTVNVEFADRVRIEDIQTVENRETVVLKGRLVSLVSLHDVLELPRQEKPGENAPYQPLLVLGKAEQQIAFRVDEILEEQEVLVKSFGPPLLRVRNVSGATILGTGKPVPILNAADLLKSAVKIAAAPRRIASVTEEDADLKPKSILIAEDSITSRMLLKNIMEAAGYVVTTAVDGLDALTRLKTQAFSLVVSDVDMPRLNGFELTAKIREDKALRETPVILVTARDTREDRERGVDVGASAYLVKSSFDQSNLLAVVQRLI